MFALNMLGGHVHDAVGSTNFLLTYAVGGLVSSGFSAACQIKNIAAYGSVGASGCMMAVLSVYYFVCPEKSFSILVYPPLDLSPSIVVPALFLLDCTGVLLKWQHFDHHAHIAGLLIGAVLYFVYLQSKGDQEHGVRAERGLVYEGPLKGFRMEGQGILTVPPRNETKLFQYQGPFCNNRFEGHGLLAQGKMSGSTMNLVSFYDGDFQKGKFHGQGTLGSPEMDYEGTFKEGMMNGQGNLRIKSVVIPRVKGIEKLDLNTIYAVEATGTNNLTTVLKASPILCLTKQ